MANIPSHMRIQNDFFATRQRVAPPASNTLLVAVGLLIGVAAAAVVLLTGLIH